MAANEMFKDHSANKNEEVIQQLVELFGNVLDLEIIQSVALNCNCDMETTSSILLDMSSNIGAVPKKPREGKKSKQKMNVSNVPAAYVQHNQDNNADVIIESEKIINCLPGAQNSTLNISSSKKTTTQLQRKSKKEHEFDRVVLHVRQGSRILILMRGLPGSGKSYLTKEIVAKGVGLQNYETFILSSDDYFINKRTGIYEYDRNKIQVAHEWNQQKAYKAMFEGISPVIIDNTNMQMWEMKPYAMMATNFGYKIEIIEPFTYWAFNDKELARRNRHGVPKAKIKDMLERYEKNVTPAKLLAVYNLTYNPLCKPPLNRTYPPIPHNEMQYNGIVNSIVNPFTVVNGENKIHQIQYKQNKEHQSFNNKKNISQYVLPETEDLMDFEKEPVIRISDDDDNDVDNNENNRNTKSISRSDPLDSILMHTSTTNTKVLEPNKWNLLDDHNLMLNVNSSEPEMKKARTYSVESLSKDMKYETAAVNTENECKKFEGLSQASSSKNDLKISKLRNIYPSLDLSSWGLSENVMNSWQTWEIVSPVNYTEKSKSDALEQDLNSKSRVIVQRSDSTTNTSSSDFASLKNDYVSSENVKIVNTKSRDINIGTAIQPAMSPPKRTLLDKSSMTNDDILIAALVRERKANDEKQIAELVSLFPNIPIDYLEDIYEKCNKDLNWAVDLLLDDKKEILKTIGLQEEQKNKYLIEKEEDESNDTSELLQTNMKELTVAVDETNENIDKKNKISSTEFLGLKKYIEENVEIKKKFYSDHVLKLKNQRRRIPSESGCSQHFNKVNSNNTENVDPYFRLEGEPVVMDSDVEMSEFDSDTDFPLSEDNEEEMVELNLGDACVAQLEAKFGFPEMFPRGFQPVVQVPSWLASQLHAFYVESVFGQMEVQNQVLEMIVREDEEFAKKLQMQEEMQHSVDNRKTPDLQQIMEDEQIASNVYKRQTEEWKKTTPDNLAAKLTRQKLFTAFPSVDEALLTEILYAHGNSYEQTVEVLLASTERDKLFDPDGTIREPPITDDVVNDMKKSEEESKANGNVPDTPKSAMEYREEASLHLRKHKELIQKAQQAYQKKQYPIAQFYSDLAKTYTQYYDQANGLAAMAFLDEHSKKLQSFHTLDLHYLYVKEAIEALDIFVDNNIQLLQGTNKKCENLYIITGRGKRSDQGRSRLKPAVMARLRKRNIWYCEMNPGLLKIRVRSTSAVTSNL